MSVHWRLRAFAPPSVDPTEATVLTPPATTASGEAAVHSEPFQVTTLHGVPGYRPYLQAPEGRRAWIDPVGKAVETGELSLRLLDPSTDGTQSARWLSAFLGDSDGRSALLGVKMQLDLTTDGGLTWTPWFTGRVQSRSLDQVIAYGIPLREDVQRLERGAFVARPSASATFGIGLLYAFRAALYPVSPPYLGWGRFLPRATLLQRGATVTGTTDNWTVVPDSGTQVRALGALVTEALAKRASEIVPLTGATRRMVFDDLAVRPRAELWDGTGRARYEVLDALINPHGSAADGYYVASFRVRRLTDVTARDYSAAAPAATQIIWSLEAPDREPPSEQVPLLISDVHPIVLWRHLLDGYFGPLQPDGSVAPGRAVAYDAAAFTAAAAWPLPPFRGRITAPVDNLREWIEAELCRPYHLSYRRDGLGRIVPLDLRRPATFPAGVLTDADLRGQPSWREVPDGAYDVLRMRAPRDVERDLAAQPGAEYATIPTDGILTLEEGVESFEIVSDARMLDWSSGEQALEPVGVRLHPGDTATALETLVDRLDSELRAYVGHGSRVITCRAVAGPVADRAVGEFVRLSCAALPNPSRNRRGGERVGLIVARTETILGPDLEIWDLGTDLVADVPTLGALSAPASDRTPITATVTRNADGDPVVVEYAIVPPGDPAPAAADARWRHYATLTASGAAAVAPRPARGTVHVRARSITTGSTGDPRRPSPWTAVQSVTVTALGTIGSLAAVEDGTTETYDLSWTNSNSTAAVLVLLEPAGEPVQRVATLPPGSTSLRLFHVEDTRSATRVLRNGTSYTVRVRLDYPDEGGGSCEASLALVTGTATAPTPPTVSASITDEAPGGNAFRAEITYSASGGTLAVTLNGSPIVAGASPWIVDRPPFASWNDVYVFTVTATNGTQASATVLVGREGFF